MEVAEKAKAEQKEGRQLDPQRIGLAEHRRQDWVVNADEGTKPDEVLAGAYWSHFASNFEQFDRIEVREETGAWVSELIVLESARNWAKVRQLQLYELDKRTDVSAAPKAHKVEWKGPQRKHVVIRIADSEAIHEGFSSKAEAEQWADNHERVTSR
jgi:hypothetical protein